MAQTSHDLEMTLIGSILFNSSRFAEAKAAGCRPSWFEDGGLSLVYSAFESFDARGELAGVSPFVVLAEARRLGGMPGERRDASGLSSTVIEKCIDCGSCGSPDSAIGFLRGFYQERELKRITRAALEKGQTAARYDDVLLEVSEAVSTLRNSTRPALAAADDVTWDKMEEPPQEEDNKRVLLRGGFFRKGHALFIVSTSGAGKSVFVNQLALFLAQGRDFLGMRPKRPLRVGVIQAEDDVEEMADFRRNYRKGLTAEFGWMDADVDAALAGVTLGMKFRGKTGDAFIAALRDWQRERKFDVVVVNPLFAYFGGNLSDGRDCTKFFREQLDPMMNDPQHGFGLVVVHHTVKPPKGEERKTWGQDAFGQYLGAGGTDIAGWSRASFLLLPIAGHYGWFRFIATKRGGRLGWKDGEGNPTNERILQYGRDAIYWRIPSDDEIPADVRKAASMAAKPAEIGEVEARSKMLAHLRVKPETTTDLWNWVLENFRGANGSRETPAKRAYLDITRNPWKFGVKTRRKGKATEYFIDNSLPGIDTTPDEDSAKVAARPVVGDYDGEDDGEDG